MGPNEALAFLASDAYHPRRWKLSMMQLPGMVTSDGRFARLLSRQPAQKPLHDTALLEAEEWLAAPSLGALVPGWLIVLPRRPALNFRRWAEGSQSPLAALSEVASGLGLSPTDYIWFEHGPQAERTQVGCGVDYAHLHMLVRPPFAFDQLVSEVQADGLLAWTESKADSAYVQLDIETSYLALGQGQRALVATEVECAGSQYLRRAVARVIGRDYAWNYRTFPQHKNIASTVEIVRCLKDNAAIRG